MVYGFYISGYAFYPIEHELAVSHEMNDAVSVSFQLRVSTKFQAASDFRKLIPCFNSILPYIISSLVIQQGVL